MTKVELKIKPKIIVILGQTATGKSDLAVKIAKVLAVSGVEAEIISADSRQVYKNLDIGTGKIIKKEMRGIPHHLLDVANPKRKFTVSQFKKLADKKIKEIIKKGKTPIVCGGTGFYIDALTKGIVFPEVPPNTKLRKDLEKKTAEELFGMLRKLDQTRSKNIDTNNKVRLVRAIEIAKALGKVPKLENSVPNWEILQIGLKFNDTILKQRIYNRLIARIKSGMLNEAKKLHRNGLTWNRMSELGLEYRYEAMYLQGKITKEEMIDQLSKAIWQYAKRQWTWFKRDKEINWFTLSEVEGFDSMKSSIKKIETLVKKFI